MAKKPKMGKTKTRVRQAATTPTRLTKELVARCVPMWMHGIEDAVIRKVYGIPDQTWKNWVSKNTIVKVNMCDEMVEEADRIESIGFRDLRDRCKELFEPRYLTRLEYVIGEAIAEKDMKCAGKYLAWLMEKRFPRKYGDKPIDNEPNSKFVFEMELL